MPETDPTHWKYDSEGAPFLDLEQLLAVREELAIKEAQRQEELQTAIQEILESEGPMLGTTLYAKLKKRYPSITMPEYRNARLALGYPIVPTQLFTLIRK
ncbi:hypothetical protein KBD71_03965 [Candidatus Woesebacteria bacterium]|nr:hypothetical protein [Candidatus Woesebacteria bacterium]